MGLDAFGLEQHVRLVDDPLDQFVAQESQARSHAIALSGFLFVSLTVGRVYHVPAQTTYSAWSFR